MKGFIAFILVFIWIAFIGLGANGPMLHDKAIKADHVICLSPVAKASEKEDCCARFHKEETAGKPCCHEDENQKGKCCNENNCPRTCCHIQVAFSSDPDIHTHNTGILNPAHAIYPSPNLPAPYLENLYPPPNVAT